LESTSREEFLPQLNKLFAESLYEVGWLEKPAAQRDLVAANAAGAV